MEMFVIFVVFMILRALIAAGRSPVSSAADLSRQADAYAAQRNYAMAEEQLQRLVKIAERQNGPNGIEVGIVLRRLAHLKAEQGDKAAPDSRERALSTR